MLNRPENMTMRASNWMWMTLWLSACDPSPSGGDSSPMCDTGMEPDGPAERDWWDLGMADPVLNEVALYYLGQAWMGATDVSEVLETLARIGPADERGWTAAFQQTSRRLRALAEATEEGGHPLTAATAYQRAATYLRAALHRHPDPGTPRSRCLRRRRSTCTRATCSCRTRPALRWRSPTSRPRCPGTSAARTRPRAPSRP
ncbi:hypothetical protein [Nannocystis pusilla]|uniref:hypothetical protein n=1 Tax=Nannocystis pusilla TaxID=889268 RepID=UPI003B77B66F